MDSSEISNVPEKTNRNKVKWRTSQEDTTKKNYVYLWAKYSLEDKQDPAKRATFKQKLAGYIEVSSS